MTLGIVSKVAEIANRLIEETPDDNYSSSISTSAPRLLDLCRLHDEVITTCQDAESRINILGKLCQFRVSPLQEVMLKAEEISSEADLYRALLGLSLYLILNIPITNSSASCFQEDELKRTIRQSVLLLKILAKIKSIATGTMEDSAPTRFPVFQEWIDQLQEAWTDQTSNVISFDRQELAMEEDQLILMASTPTPWELNQQTSIIEETKELLVARMPVTVLGKIETATVQVRMDHRGLIRLMDQEDSTWWAALTASSTTHYKSPTFTIKMVVTQTKTSLGTNPVMSLGTLPLQVGRDGHQWWEVTSAIIEQLKELQQLQDEVASVCTKDKEENSHEEQSA